MIKPYPYFSLLEKIDKPAFDLAFKNFPPEISECTFTNLYSWRGNYGFQVSSLDGALILRFAAKNKAGFFYPLGIDHPEKVIKTILAESGAVFYRLPESLAILFADHPDYLLEEDPDNADYLYQTSDLIDLAGRKYDGKRNQIRKFKSENNYEYKLLEGVNARECLEFEENWCTIKNCDSVEGLSQERAAINQMVDSCESFKLIVGAIRVSGKISAVAIAEKLNPDTLVMHVLKADPNIPGLYQVMMNEFLAREAKDIPFINLEQDLGIEGLKKSKLSYHPIRMIKKYTLVKTGTVSIFSHK